MPETIFYFDSSVALRILLNEENVLANWCNCAVIMSSRLLRLECMRAIERYRVVGDFSADDTLELKRDCYGLMKRIIQLPITETVLRLAESSFATSVKSLDSIHLATALWWRDTRGTDFIFATHDQQLARVVSAQNIHVIGV